MNRHDRRRYRKLYRAEPPAPPKREPDPELAFIGYDEAAVIPDYVFESIDGLSYKWRHINNATHASDAFAYACGVRARKVYDNGRVVDLSPDEYLIHNVAKEITDASED